MSLAFALRRLNKEERLSHFANLVSLANRDGKVTEVEGEMLLLLCSKWGLPREDALAVMENPGRVPARDTTDPEARFQELFDLTELMVIDGEVGPKERSWCAALAGRVGFDESCVNIVAQEVLEGNRRNASEVNIQEAARKRLKALGKLP